MYSDFCNKGSMGIEGGYLTHGPILSHVVLGPADAKPLLYFKVIQRA